MNASAPLVSVAIVTYQHARFVEAAVRSVLDQDYERIEIVVSDDNSTDGTQAVLQRLATEHPDRLTVVLNDGDRSVARNVNRALAQCRGDFVCLFDGDDYLLPGKIAAQVRHMIANPTCHVCFHAAETFDSDTGAPQGIVGDPDENDRSTAADLVARGNFLPLCSTMMRRSAMPAAGVPAELRYVADWVLLIETTRHGTFESIPGVYARYRQHPGGITAQSRVHSPVWRDSLLTMDLIAARHPELARYCRRGKAHVFSWEAHRRARGGAAAVQIVPMLLAAVALEPQRWRLLRTAARTLHEGVAQRRPLFAV